MLRKFEKRSENILYGVELFLKATILLAVFGGIYRGNWDVVFVSLLAFVLTFLPAILEKRVHVTLPIELELLFVLFVYTGIFLGEVHSYYAKFWWWDVALHTSAGAALGLIGFILIFVLNGERKIVLSPGFIALFGFTFALALGAVWEIFEFGMDSFFGMTMQKSGLVDTMWDLIVDSVGALVVAVLGYLYVKYSKEGFVKRAVKRFARHNPGLFDK